MVRLGLFALLWLAALVSGVAAESAGNNTVTAIDVASRGGLAPPYRGTALTGNLVGPLEFNVRAGLASDYIFRGVTLTNHNPVVGAGAEAAFGLCYAGATVASVQLPTNPAAEFSFTGGIRPKIWNIEFDFGVTYLLYPGETPGSDTDYWEAVARADYKITEAVGIAAGFAYSPNISNTGAWSRYAAAGVSVDLPQHLLPRGVGVSVSGSAGYYWFGDQSPALGGFPLPAYANWTAGVTLSRKPFNLDLRYSNTNLTKENCFVFTGDPGAAPGGRINPITNPEGLTSNWCGPAYVAKLWFSLDWP
jgi:uncharacterized protein (TIGR02001 family)